MKKVVSVLLILLTVCTFFAACSKKKTVTIENDKKININGKIVNGKLYNYYLSMELLNNPTATDNENEAAALKSTARQFYIAEKCQEKGIQIDDEARKVIDEQIDYVVGQYGSKEEFEKEIAQFSLDYDSYYALLENGYLENLLKDETAKGFTEEQRLDFYNNNMINVQHILFMTVDENQTPLDEVSVQEKLTLAKDVQNKINDGVDFMDLLAQYNEDPGLTDEGYMMSKYTSFVKPFLDAALELDVGEVTDLVETSYGYHIIKRYEHKDNTQLYLNSMDEINAGLFEQQFDNWYEDAKIVVN